MGAPGPASLFNRGSHLVSLRGLALTDPLTGKQLVEKSYEYIDKLTRECAKSLVDEFNSTHRKFEPNSCASEVGSSVVNWFAKRDRNVRLSVESVNSSVGGQPKSASVGFRGNTKDSDFQVSALIGTFAVPTAEGKQVCYVKTLVFSVEKNAFTKRKS